MACKMSIPLSSGGSIPVLGYGTWQAKDEELEAALENALEAGYRHIDTAAVYDNEHVIGKVLKRWMDVGKLKREDLFITTKLPMYGNRPDEVALYLKESLKKLQLSYVDLYLIHAPFGYFKVGDVVSEWKMDTATDHAALWKEMEKQVDEGRTKSIGVSNFNIKQVDRLLKIARIPPVTNQVELHAYLQQPELVTFLKNNNVTLTAYSPLGTRGTQKFFEQRGIQSEIPNLMEDPVVLELSQKYKKTSAQILLRHLIQKGLIAIPKSTNLERLKQNMDIFDFKLEDSDMVAMNGLDRQHRIVDFSKVFKDCANHPEYPF